MCVVCFWGAQHKVPSTHMVIAFVLVFVTNLAFFDVLA